MLLLLLLWRGVCGNVSHPKGVERGKKPALPTPLLLPLPLLLAVGKGKKGGRSIGTAFGWTF